MNADLNPPANVPQKRNVVLFFKVPVTQGDGGYHLPVAHVGRWMPEHNFFWITSPGGSRPCRIPFAQLIGWTEIPAAAI